MARAELELSVGSDAMVVSLTDPRALDAGLVGAKAASLARAAGGGLPVLPGTVLTTRFSERVHSGRDVGELLEAAWLEASDGGKHRVVVRSSSTWKTDTPHRWPACSQPFWESPAWKDS